MFHNVCQKILLIAFKLLLSPTARKLRNIHWCHMAKWRRAAVSSTGLERTKEWHGTTPSP